MSRWNFKGQGITMLNVIKYVVFANVGDFWWFIHETVVGVHWTRLREHPTLISEWQVIVANIVVQVATSLGLSFIKFLKYRGL